MKFAFATANLKIETLRMRRRFARVFYKRRKLKLRSETTSDHVGLTHALPFLTHALPFFTHPLPDMPNDLPYILCCDWNFYHEHGEQLAWIFLWCKALVKRRVIVDDS